METMPVSVLVIDADSVSRNYLTAMLARMAIRFYQLGWAGRVLISAWRDKPEVIILDPDYPICLAWIW